MNMNISSLLPTNTSVQSELERSAALVNSFLSGRNERTIQAYRQDLEDFRAFVGTENIDQAARTLLSGGHGDANSIALSYKSSVMARGLQAATINRRLAALRSLVKLARTLGMVPWSLEVENMKAEAYRDTRGPGQDGFISLLDEVGKRNDGKAIRDRAILHLLHDLALRRGEVVSLDVEDVDLQSGTVSILGKGRTQKELISIPEPTKAALVEWLNERGMEAGPLFVNYDRAGKGQGQGRLTGTGLYMVVRGLGEKTGRMVRPHGIRHTAITEACKAAQAHGMGLEEVMDFSRHKNVRTLMVYRDRDRNVQGRLAALVASAGLK
jgi:integrase/recombinase XerC